MGDHVFLKVSLFKGVMRFGQKEKLSPRYIGPFEILRRWGSVAYELALPPEHSSVHPVFHMSMLRKYLSDESHVLQPQVVKVDSQMSYIEEPIVVVDRQVRKLHLKEIPSVKVIWNHHSENKAIWELKKDMRRLYPQPFLKVCLAVLKI